MSASAAPPGAVPASVWVAGARPRTLGAAVVAVLAGAAASGHPFSWQTPVALLVAVSLQIGVNYANDYFDGISGIDRDRVGPVRLTASGLAPPRAVLNAALFAVGIGAAAGLALALATQPLLLLAGAAAIAAVLLYSGGPRPYASLGLGDLMVLLFFGPVAVCGTALTIAGHVPAAAWWASASVGLLAVAILIANNARDIVSDRLAGKRTLAVRLGAAGTRGLFVAVIAAAFVLPVIGVISGAMPRWSLLILLALPLTATPIAAVRDPARIRVALPATAKLHLAAGLLLTLGLALP